MKSRGGFTFIEMMVVLVVTVFLSILTIVYNRSGHNQILMFKDQAVVVGLLNRAKSLAIQKYQNPLIAANDYDFCAFGVHFEAPRTMILFADLGVGTCSVDDANYRYDPAASPPEALETQTLDIRNEFIGLPDNGLDVLFVAPELTATSSVAFPVTVTISSVSGGSTSVANTTISAAGQIVAD
ncbi:MAG TPA: prepilin-type N-terminal cleavage/methylation domain-containing protein [Candidatus Paceibacterota bacterium]|nr:prepilin-type N-terminal cleavage/methylation domain-containing protein [Candidatus Paceibacterota bacterium]